MASNLLDPSLLKLETNFLNLGPKTKQELTLLYLGDLLFLLIT